MNTNSIEKRKATFSVQCIIDLAFASHHHTLLPPSREKLIWVLTGEGKSIHETARRVSMYSKSNPNSLKTVHASTFFWGENSSQIFSKRRKRRERSHFFMTLNQSTNSTLTLLNRSYYCNTYLRLLFFFVDLQHSQDYHISIL